MRRQRGVALVEFALLMPFMLILTLSVTEIGRAYYQYNTIAKSVREGARYLSVRARNVDVDKASNIVVYGMPVLPQSPSAPPPPLALGLKVSMVSAAWDSTGSYPTFNTVTVSVTGYKFVPLVSSVFGVSLSTNALGTIDFGTIQATMRSPT